MVYFECYISNISPATSADPQQIQGLPFTHKTNAYSAVSIGYCVDANFNDALPLVGSGASYIYFHQNDGSAATLTRNDFNSRRASGAAFIISGVYTT